MPEFFDVLVSNVKKVADVAITATSDAAPQTVVTLTTVNLPAGEYLFGYSFQALHSAKNQPMYFKTGGDISDAQYFANSAGDNDETHVNRYYAYPYTHSGGVLTITLLVYKPVGSVTLEFADLFIHRIG